MHAMQCALKMAHGHLQHLMRVECIETLQQQEQVVLQETVVQQQMRITGLEEQSAQLQVMAPDPPRVQGSYL